MIALTKKYWVRIAAAAAIVLFICFLFGPCEYIPSGKKEKTSVDTVNAQLARETKKYQQIIDSLRNKETAEKTKADSLLKAKSIVEKKLQAESKEATKWAWMYTVLINKQDTAGAIVACDSIVQSNNDLMAVVEEYKTNYDSTVAIYDRQLDSKDEQIQTHLNFIEDQRRAIAQVNEKFDSMYEQNKRLRKNYTRNKAGGKIKSVALLATTGYILFDIITKH